MSVIWTVSQEDLNKEHKWIVSETAKIGQGTLENLAKAALEQKDLAYLPYSNYKVGVAILTKSGKIYRGNNVERASYSETDHAEEAAITNAVVNGEVKASGRKFLVALACCHAGDSAPCGRCRQIMAEHTDNCLDPDGNIRRITSLAVLLPYAFTPTDLGINE